jgi:hypothetical protein
MLRRLLKIGLEVFIATYSILKERQKARVLVPCKFFRACQA